MFNCAQSEDQSNNTVCCYTRPCILFSLENYISSQNTFHDSCSSNIHTQYFWMYLQTFPTKRLERGHAYNTVSSCLMVQNMVIKLQEIGTIKPVFWSLPIGRPTMKIISRIVHFLIACATKFDKQSCWDRCEEKHLVAGCWPKITKQ